MPQVVGQEAASVYQERWTASRLGRARPQRERFSLGARAGWNRRLPLRKVWIHATPPAGSTL